MHMVEMVSENARIELERFNERIDGAGSVQEGLNGMSAILGLQQVPERLEAYDISNTGTSEVVASMVVFEKGLPAKKEYRRFKIRSTDKQNDYAAMQEVLYRRLKHVEAEKAELERLQAQEARYEQQKEQQKHKAGQQKFSRLPDLIMLDGGLGHVNAIGQVLSELGITIPHVGMVKDDKHRTRGLVLPDREIDLTDNLPVLRLVTSVQDEAHRFALEYNKKLRAKRYSKSILDEIEGIGPKRKKALIKHFGSISRIRQAGVDDLQAVEGISQAIAEKVYEFFR